MGHNDYRIRWKIGNYMDHVVHYHHKSRRNHRGMIEFGVTTYPESITRSCDVDGDESTFWPTLWITWYKIVIGTKVVIQIGSTTNVVATQAKMGIPGTPYWATKGSFNVLGTWRPIGRDVILWFVVVVAATAVIVVVLLLLISYEYHAWDWSSLFCISNAPQCFFDSLFEKNKESLNSD